MKKTFLAVLCVVLFSSGTILGQPAQRISLEDAINIALENNFQIKVAENNLELANNSIRSEYADFLPSLDAGLSGNRRSGLDFLPERLSDGLDPFVNVTSQSINGNIGTSIPIFNGFNNIISLRTSQQNQISREESLQRIKEEIIFQTATSFLQVILSEELLNINRTTLESIQQQLDQVKVQVEVGALAIVNQYELESTLAQQEFLLTQGENTLILNKLSLVRQLQIDPLGNYEFILPDIDLEQDFNEIEAYDLNTLIDEALMTRSDIKSQEALIKSFEYLVQGSKASLLPTIFASGSISSGYSDQFTNPAGGDGFNDQFFDLRVNKSIGISLNLSLFENLNRLTTIQESQVNLKNERLSLEDTKLNVIQDVTTAYTDYIAGKKEAEALEKTVRFAERSFETQQERFNVGASTLIELTQARTSFIEAQSNYTQSVYNLIFQEKLLDFYLGKLSGETIEF